MADVSWENAEFPILESEPSSPSTADTFTLYQLSDGTVGTKTDGGTVTQLNNSGGGAPDYIRIEHQETSGTAGGGVTGSTWNTRTLNTEVTDSGGHATLSSNQVTLASGTYQFIATAFAGAGNAVSRFRLYNVTDTAVIAQGIGAQAKGTFTVTGQFTIATSKAIELQQWSNVTRATDAQGEAVSTGSTEVYATLDLWKIA
jgi:hypothetical protein